MSRSYMIIPITLERSLSAMPRIALCFMIAVLFSAPFAFGQEFTRWNEFRIGSSNVTPVFDDTKNGEKNRTAWIKAINDQFYKLGATHLAVNIELAPGEKYGAVLFQKDGSAKYVITYHPAGKRDPRYVQTITIQGFEQIDNKNTRWFTRRINPELPAPVTSLLSVVISGTLVRLTRGVRKARNGALS